MTPLLPPSLGERHEHNNGASKSMLRRREEGSRVFEAQRVCRGHSHLYCLQGSWHRDGPGDCGYGMLLGAWTME